MTVKPLAGAVSVATAAILRGTSAPLQVRGEIGRLTTNEDLCWKVVEAGVFVDGSKSCSSGGLEGLDFVLTVPAIQFDLSELA